MKEELEKLKGTCLSEKDINSIIRSIYLKGVKAGLMLEKLGCPKSNIIKVSEDYLKDQVFKELWQD